jgi:hypothetical protein
LLAERRTDVEVRLGKVIPDLPPRPPLGKVCFPVTAKEGYLFWDDAGAVVIREGREIVADPLPGVDKQSFGSYIQGPAVALLLYQRGLLVLHASAVAVGKQAIAFLGEVGCGKSTLAAALHVQRHSILADDVTAIDLRSGLPQVLPGSPHLRLWANAAASFRDHLQTGPRVHRCLAKHFCAADRGFSETPLLLERIYVLVDGPDVLAELLSPQDAVVELVRHSYAVRKYQGEGLSSHFLQCVHLAKKASVFRLRRPRKLSMLPVLTRFVEQQLNVCR